MTNPVSLFLSWIAVAVAFGVLVGAAIAGYSALVVLLGLAIAAALITKLWSRLSLKRVSGERRLSAARVFPGDEVSLTLRVVNSKLLPLPWIEIRDEVPAALVPGAAPPAETTPSPAVTDPAAPARSTPNGGASDPAVPDNRAELVTLSRSTPLLWYSAATFTQQLDASARGYYPLGPLAVTSGDIFGLHPRDLVEPHIDHLIVYPRTYTLAELGIPSLSHLGDVRSHQRIFDDPSRLMGLRDYEPGDSPRRIHWKATARTGALQVKLFESTTDLKVAVFLGIDTFSGRTAEELELGISTAASVARHLIERDMQTGLYVNTRLADSGRSAWVAPASGSAHLALMLETLAKTTAESDESLLDFFEAVRGELGFGGTLVFVVGDVSPELRSMLTDLKEAGRRVVGFKVGGGGRGDGGGGDGGRANGGGGDRGDGRNGSAALDSELHWHRVDPKAVLG